MAFAEGRFSANKGEIHDHKEGHFCNDRKEDRVQEVFPRLDSVVATRPEEGQVEEVSHEGNSEEAKDGP